MGFATAAQHSCYRSISRRPDEESPRYPTTGIPAFRRKGDGLRSELARLLQARAGLDAAGIADLRLNNGRGIEQAGQNPVGAIEETQANVAHPPVRQKDIAIRRHRQVAEAAIAASVALPEASNGVSSAIAVHCLARSTRRDRPPFLICGVADDTRRMSAHRKCTLLMEHLWPIEVREYGGTSS